MAVDTSQNGENTMNGAKVTASRHASNGREKAPQEGREKLASKAKPKPTPRKVMPTKSDKEGVANALERCAQIFQATIKPAPNQEGPGPVNEPRKWGKLKQDLKTLRSADIKTLKQVVLARVKGEKLTDDKTMIMERVIQLVANLPNDSKLRVELTNTFLGELWNSLGHPPSLYVGDKYRYRQADGSYNNIMFPQLGAAGSPYARSVNTTVLRKGALPDPGLVFDSVMKRTEYKKHPNNVSSILWYWASIVIHDLFWTDHHDVSRSKTSSYLDLSPLYGSNQEMQNTIRTFKDGKLKPDCFADKRIHGLPPGVGVLLIMFNRFHNYVCDNLISINEDGRFTAPSPSLQGDKAAAAWKKYDEDLFQTARLVTSGLYINIMLLDYVRNIVNLNRVDTTWTLDPRVNTGIEADVRQGAERGTGNVVSAEFNLCYRWHSCISEKDEKWIEEFYWDLFGKPSAEVGVQDLLAGFAMFESRLPEDPLQRPFNKFKRGPDGKFSDDDLVECIVSAIEDCAGSFGARNVPASMRAIEILGIIQGRKWNVASLNEFRRHFGLKPYETFEDINSDPGVADALRRLYDHPDFVELYPGIVAEERKEPMVPGVGIAPTYTISRVVLSDAVVLVRSDRHYTIDYSPRHLTNWGYNDVQYDLNVNHGCVFYKLFLNAFPNHFNYNSVYAHYPMVVPSETEKIVKDLKRDHLFDFCRPGRLRKTAEVKEPEGVRHVLAGQEKYRGAWLEALRPLADQGKAKLSGDAKTHDQLRQQVSESVFDDDFVVTVKAFYRQKVAELLDLRSYDLAGNRMADLVRDVAALAPTYFVSELFGLPLESRANKKGFYTEHELHVVLSTIATVLFTQVDVVKKFPLLQAVKTLSSQLATAIEKTVKSPKSNKSQPLSSYGAKLIKALTKAGVSRHDITWAHVLAASAAVVAYQTKIFTEAVDFYLSPARAQFREAIQSLATQPASEQVDSLLLGYALEGIRLGGSTHLVFQAVAADTIPTVENSIEAGDFVTLNTSPSACEPAQPDPSLHTHARSLYAHLDASPDAVFLGGTAVRDATLVEFFRAVFARKNLRRTPGPQGELKKVVVPDRTGKSTGRVQYMRDDWAAYSAWPASMRVAWDE